MAIDAGIEAGATLAFKGDVNGFGDQGSFMAPHILTGVTPDMPVWQHEIFGPVLVIIPFESEEEAIKIANDSPYGLGAYLQTGDKERAQRVSKALRAGAVHINGGGFNYGSPFGGYKQSGNGREGGEMGIEDYLETKTVHIGA